MFFNQGRKLNLESLVDQIFGRLYQQDIQSTYYSVFQNVEVPMFLKDGYELCQDVYKSFHREIGG